VSELPALARRLRTALEQSARLALATVVSTEGSAYRRAGAWMTIDPDGRRQGQVSGGCLEADLAERAAAVLAGGVAEVVTYDTRHPDDLIWGLGLGCQGIVRVLVEPLSGDRLRRMAAFCARAAEDTEPAVLVTTIAGEAGDRFLVTAREVISSGTRPLPEEIERDARQRLGAGEPASTRAYGRLEVSFENLLPRTRLILCGAGEDAVPLAQLAGELDWSVQVIDHRAAWATLERFPAARVDWIENPRDLSALFGAAHARTAAVVMSHNFDRDVRYAAALLPLGLPYLGLLGPRKRGEQILGAAEGFCPEGARPSRVFSPVGLDIASETPREIALAIVAEISAVLAGRSGGHLKDKAAAIHQTAGEGRAAEPAGVESWRAES
jgi:xanthine dehydrogenase accessory factor